MEILNEITVIGIKLHARSVERLGEDRFLHPREIISEFFLSNRRIDLNIQDCLQAGKLGGQSPRIQSIISGISKFFERSTSGCLTLSGSMNFAIWKNDGYFYCFEPGVYLMRFENDILLTEKLLEYGVSDTDFEITSIDIVDWNKLPPWKFDPSPAVRPSNLPATNAYSRLPGKY